MKLRLPKIAARLLAGAALLALSACRASDEDKLLDVLFASANLPSAGATSYVIWVNGDADHFVPLTSTAAKADVKRADAVEVQRIDEAAKRCGDCNVLLLHVQRAGARWYTADAPFATYFRVYVRGQVALERKVPILNAANPNLIARLLLFTDQYFATSSRNFMYRGHGFIPGYDPETAQKDLLPPFAFSHPESPFGPAQFIEGLRRAQLRAPLESITLAACSMADLPFLAALAPYAKQAVAPEVDILETLNVSFDYGFLDQSRTTDLSGAISTDGEWIASRLMDRFVTTRELTESMLEFPVTVVATEFAVQLQKDLAALSMQVRVEDPLFFGRMRPAMDQAAHVQKVLSDVYLQKLQNEGKAAASIQAMATFVRSVSAEPERVDVGQWLDFLAQARLPYKVTSAAAELRGRLTPSAGVQVFHNPAVSKKSGLSIQLGNFLGGIGLQ